MKALDTSTKFGDGRPDRCREIDEKPLPRFWVLDLVVFEPANEI